MATEQEIYSGLVQRGLAPHAALGIVSRMKAESRLDPGINEIAPVVPGSRGGYGLNQWTGPRRRQYEAFAAERGVVPSDVDTQLDFTVWELQNTERAAAEALAGTSTPEEAAQVYMEKFLRPGIPHRDMRVDPVPAQYAPQGNALATQAPPVPENALGQYRPRFQYNNFQLDPNAFRMT